MADRVYNVLFLCTGNSARSILGEALLNQMGQGRFRAYSAGSRPKGEVHSLALELIEKNGLPTAGLRSKSWDEFAQPGAPAIDFVFTVCDNAAGEACPVWPGRPMTTHWGIDDPAAATGTLARQRKAFLDTYHALRQRIALFLSLPLTKLDPIGIKQRLEQIGKSGEQAVQR